MSRTEQAGSSLSLAMQFLGWDRNAGVSKYLVVLFLFSSAYSVLILATPLFTIQIFTRILVSQSSDTLIVLAAVTLICLAFAAFLDVIRVGIAERLANRFNVSVGSTILPQVLDRSTPLTSAEGPLQDVNVIRRFIGSRELLSLMDLPFSVLYIGIVIVVHLALGLFVAGLTAAILMLALLASALSTEPEQEMNEKARKANDDLGQFMLQSSTLSCLALGPSVARRWLEDQVAVLRVERRHKFARDCVSFLQRTLRLSSQVLVMSLAVYLALRGDINPGLIIASSILATRAITPIETLPSGYRSMRRALEAFHRIRRVISAPVANIVSERPSEALNVAAKAVVYFHSGPGRQQPTVRGVSLTLEPGDLICVVGPSGGGKSTLAKLLSGGLSPASGSIKINGHDLRDFSPEALKSMIGYLPQVSDVFPGTIVENISRFRDMDESGLWDALKLFDLDYQLQQFPQRLAAPMARAATELSPGLYRRILLTRAFYGAPPLLVLDEPGANLDQEGENLLEQNIVRARQSGAAMFLVSPPRRLMNLASRTLVMRNGFLEDLNSAGSRPAAVSSGPGLLTVF